MVTSRDFRVGGDRGRDSVGYQRKAKLSLPNLAHRPVRVGQIIKKTRVASIPKSQATPSTARLMHATQKESDFLRFSHSDSEVTCSRPS